MFANTNSAFMDESALRLLETAYDKLRLTPTQRLKAVRVAETIARLDRKQRIEAAHIAEAIQYRAPVKEL